MPSHLFILTGASRGMGAAMAEQLLAPDVTLLGLSRRIHEALPLRAQAVGAVLEQWPCDLSRPVEVALALTAWLHPIDPQRFDSATLINNAGVISRIGPLDDTEPTDLAQALRVGLEAPVHLTAAFLRGTREWRGRRQVLNISSGLGRRAMAGTATYCAAKAGLDHFSRAVALEEEARPNGARIVSLAPGVIDTNMQVQLRTAHAEGFPDQPRFAELKDSGQLSSPQEAARRVLAWLQRADFGTHPVADVRDLA
jgi:benzil reductase ((S)-benzoin forming)